MGQMAASRIGRLSTSFLDLLPAALRTLFASLFFAPSRLLVLLFSPYPFRSGGSEYAHS